MAQKISSKTNPSLLIRTLIAVLFLFVTVKSSIFVFDPTPKNKDSFSSNVTVKTAGQGVANDMTFGCCCDMSDRDSRNCCCKSPTLGNDLRKLVIRTSRGKSLDAIISSVRCSNLPGDFQIGSLSDYEYPSINTFLHLLEDTNLLAYLQEDQTTEPHLFLPDKPPRDVS